MSENKRHKAWLAVLTGIAVLLLILLIATNLPDEGGNAPTGQRPAVQAPARRTTTQATTVAPIPVELSELTGNANPLYLDKVVQVEGEVTRIAKLLDYYVKLEGDIKGYIKCFFSDPHELAKIAELKDGFIKDGDQVIVTGKYDEYYALGALRNCTVELADGTAIELTPMPPIKNGVCVLTMEEFVALDFGRNFIRRDILLGNAQVQITARVIRKAGIHYHYLSDSYRITIGDDTHETWFGVSGRDFQEISEGDTITVVGRPGLGGRTLTDCRIVEP
jgi:hypothetical protein